MSDIKEKLLVDNSGDPIDENQTPQLAHDTENKANETQNPNQQQEQIEDSEPAQIYLNLKNKFQKMEDRFRNNSGIVFMIATGFLFSVFRLVRQVTMPENTVIEIAYIAFLVAFLVNYYLVRVGNVLPYIEDEDKNFTGKLAGFSALFTIIFLIYGMQVSDTNSCVFIFVLTWIISFITEKIYFGSQIPAKQLGLFILITVFSFLVLDPVFLNQYDETKYDPESGVSLADTIANFTNKQQKGLISAFFGALCFSYMCFNIRKVKDYDFVTVTHIICLIVTLFLAIFFPIEGLKSPNVAQWGIMIVLGLVFMIWLYMFVRSIQLEYSSKVLGVLPVTLGFFVIFDIFSIGQTPEVGQIIGTVGLLASYYFIYKNNQQIGSQIYGESNLTRSGDKIYELKNINPQN